MTLSPTLYSKLSLLMFAFALQPAFGQAGYSASAATPDKVAESEASVAASVATNPAAASLVTAPPLPAATAQPSQAAAEAVAEAAAAVQVVEPGAPAANARPAAVASTVFPKISPRWRKWDLGLIDAHARKNNWQVLPADSVRIITHSSWGWGTAFQVNLSTGDVTVLRGKVDVPNIRPFKLQQTELDDLRKLIEGKPFADLATENQTVGRDGYSLLVEADWKGEYRWRLYWAESPYPLKEIQELLEKAHERELQRRG